MSEKIKVIYIAGAGRSGSTLLDMVISTSDQIFSVGEIYRFNDIMERNASCACGRYVSNCRFWKSLYANRTKIKIKNRINVENYLRIVNYLFNPFSRKNLFRSDIADNRVIFNEAINYSRDRDDIFVLDSSKDVGRLIELSNDSSIDLYCIHVVRDPKGVVNSYSSKTAGGSQNIFLVILKWLIINTFIRKFLRISAIKNIVINLENFCANSDKEINRIEKFLGIKIPADYTRLIREMDYHNIGGNRMSKMENRLRFSGIKLNCKWKKELNKIKILTVDFFCSHIFKKIGT